MSNPQEIQAYPSRVRCGTDKTEEIISNQFKADIASTNVGVILHLFLIF